MAKEFLRLARTADRRAEETIERVERIRAKLEAGRQSKYGTDTPRGGTSDWTETADRLIELEKRINAQTRDMVRLKLAALDAIQAVDDARMRELLELYYLDGYTWERVAERMELTERWVLILHGRALLKVKVPEEYT